MANESEVRSRRRAALATTSDLGSEAVKNITAALNALLADVFTLYLKTKNFHWHVSGPHFSEYHVLFDAQANEILEMTDAGAERVRKIGGTTIQSLSQIVSLRRLADNDLEYVEPLDMLAELREDNTALVASLRQLHHLCDDEHDMATTSLIETWIDQA